MKAIILCAGYATRLYPLTKNNPKPLLKVGGKPMVEHVLDKIDELEVIDCVYIVTNDKFSTHFNEWKENSLRESKIIIVNDGTTSNEDRLGSVGDIQFVLDNANIQDDVIIINGDNLFEDSLNGMYSMFNEKDGSVVAFKDVKDLEIAKLMGVAALNEEGRIIEFVEKPAQPKSTFVSTGIYMIKKEDLHFIKKVLETNNQTGEVKTGEMIIYMMDKTNVYGKVFNKAWFDVGSHEQLKEADEYWSSK